MGLCIPEEKAVPVRRRRDAGGLCGLFCISGEILKRMGGMEEETENFRYIKKKKIFQRQG